MKGPLSALFFLAAGLASAQAPGPLLNVPPLSQTVPPSLADAFRSGSFHFMDENKHLDVRPGMGPVRMVFLQPGAGPGLAAVCSVPLVAAPAVNPEPLAPMNTPAIPEHMPQAMLPAPPCSH